MARPRTTERRWELWIADPDAKEKKQTCAARGVGVAPVIEAGAVIEWGSARRTAREVSTHLRLAAGGLTCVIELALNPSGPKKRMRASDVYAQKHGS